MLVWCEVGLCPYHSTNNFCKKEVVGINSGGQCMQIYDRHGRIKSKWQQKEEQEIQKDDQNMREQLGD